MIEKMKHIENPLTIVAIFAVLVELAGTVLPTTIDERYHIVIVCFVVVFPVLLVALFFFTLWYKPGVWYGPSNFHDDSSFLQILSSNNSLSGDRGQSFEEFNKDVSQMTGTIDSAQSSIEHHAIRPLFPALTRSRLQCTILYELHASPEALSLSGICEKIKRAKTEVKKGLERMVRREIVKTINHSGEILYVLNLRL
jgi:hypothetical protein